MVLRIAVIGEQRAIRAVASIPPKVAAGGAVGMREAVDQGAAVVRGNASGRPGPNVISGAHRAGIQGRITSQSLTLVSGEIFASSPQAPRLEFGFFGPDSLGRVYNQGPFPYFGPAIPDITARAPTLVAAGIRATLTF